MADLMPWEAISTPNSSTAPVDVSPMPWEAVGVNPYSAENINNVITQNRERSRVQRERQVQATNNRAGRGFFENFANDSRVLAQGIPVLRNFVNTTPESEEQANAFPTSTAAGRVLAGTAALAPVAVGGMVLSGPGAAATIGTQAALGATTALADRSTSTNPPRNLQDAVTTGGFGALGGAIPASVARLFRPSGFNMPPNAPPSPQPAPMPTAITNAEMIERMRLGLSTTRSPNLAPIATEAAARVRAEPHNETVRAMLDNATWPLVGYASGHYFGDGPVAGALGAAGTIAARNRIRAFQNNHPSYAGRRSSLENQAILNALGLNAFPQLAPPSSGPPPNIPTLRGN